MNIINLSSILILCFNINLSWCDSETEDDIDFIEPTLYTTLIPEQTKELTFIIPDDKWLVVALQNIAYYLRNYKFNEWDRRYHTQKPNDDLIGFYVAFPNPSLRSIHWKVYENCYADFYKCISYLNSIIETSPFTRTDDITIMLNKKISLNNTVIEYMNDNCKKALLYSEKTALPFDAPNEKFQWRTSASYYMCWYTILGVPALSMLGESCDNFANCLDPTFRNRNHDPRADDKYSFACARYSFCPDPCCPLKHVKALSECYNSKRNPCHDENALSADSVHRKCVFERIDNDNFDQMIANKWNVTCHCRQKGFEYKSQFGMCVDINECTSNKHNCCSRSENCLNLPGTFKCICKWGFMYDNESKECIEKDIFVNTDIRNEENDFSFVDNLKCFLEYIGFWNVD